MMAESVILSLEGTKMRLYYGIYKILAVLMSIIIYRIDFIEYN